MITPVTIDEVKRITFNLTRQILSWDEPIPDFEERYEGILESCLNQPFQAVFGKTLYPGLSNKASILFYLLIKNHPFKNGNKRIAIITTNYFLITNNHIMMVNNDQMYELSRLVAESKPNRKEVALRNLYYIFKTFACKFDLDKDFDSQLEDMHKNEKLRASKYIQYIEPFNEK